MATYRPGTTGWIQEQRAKQSGTKTVTSGGGSVSKPVISSGSGSKTTTPSAGNVLVNTAGQQTIKDQMNANSQAWHTADEAGKKALEQANKDLAAQLGSGVGFDPSTGTWAGSADKVLDPPVAKPEYPYQYPLAEDMWNEIYERTSAAEQAAIDAYIKQQVNSLESQKSGITQSADEAARQAYISYMQSQATLPQALAASGYSGGMADSQRLALEAGLQNNQREILLNRDNALNGVDTAIQQARLEGSIQGAQAQAELGRDAISAYQQYINQQNAYANQDFWSKYGYDFQGGQAQTDRDFQAGQSQLDRDWQSGQAQADRDWQSGQSQTDQETAEQQAARKLLQSQVLEMIQAGQLPGDDLLEAAGISKVYAQTMAPFYASQLTAQTAGQGSGTGRQGGTSGQSNAQYLPRGGEDGDNITTPVPAITAISQLGPAALRIANGMSRVTMNQNKAGYVALIEESLKNQSISAEEAQYLLDMIGIAP